MKAINKINESETKAIGFQEAKTLIENNIDRPSLRVFLSVLTEKYKSRASQNKELQVLLFGHIAKFYRTNMVDPIDKPASLLKTAIRVCENIHFFLKEDSTLVHLACAQSLIEVLENCFTNKEEKMTLTLIFYEPLACIINGGFDTMA
jgi:hypothetical protein